MQMQTCPHTHTHTHTHTQTKSHTDTHTHTHTHTQTALCYNEKFDEAVKSLNDAKEVLSSHLELLKKDTFNARVSEIDELEELLPKIDEKVKDTIEMKAHP